MTQDYKDNDADTLRAQAFATVILNEREEDARGPHGTRPLFALLQFVTGLWRGALDRRVIDASHDRMVDAVTL
ncbi:MAG: hypothetical protein U1E42_11680 [Rhodospirillales bacterium]